MQVSLKKKAIQKTRIPEGNIFAIRELQDKHFDTTWHAHLEYQLFLVMEGTGTKFIGNTVKPFDKGDLTFLGPNIPHLWRSDESYFEQQSAKTSRGLVIYFNGAALGQLMEKEEFTQLRTLLEKVRHGMEIYGKSAKETALLMHELLYLHGMERVIHLLRIFDLLAKSKEYHLLHDDVVFYQPKDMETNRINTVYNYAAQRFRHKITLEEVSTLLNMTPTSFSRYFTMKTSKSFSYFLTELRIRNACKLLSTDEAKNIAQICYESGFNTLSNFNKQFKTFIGMTPTEYRQKFLLTL
ncbi:AraC-type DNA-binding protein [Parapedobacter composti]|uniref:AraC-type DNA-binding protein n=1 Tax=Parapedobacter composti TaxID=623281 RepID=A0A1I1DWI1_9SPHI|nr:helix-turn-helix domain-containing protein [Parapedobacter composti]SFB79251.1 AraC-type DNA-binding protein [Parapedobacter composti]